ncbi:MAG: DUF1926 domain-containing protein [Treponema sp.]|nr:DUF1926 domain-containing protein [Treponema sp.]
MNSICVCLQIDFSLTQPRAEDMESVYQKYIKGILSFLYANPKVFVSVSFTGPQLAWLDEKHPECIRLLSDLTSRKQVEILGGGYYLPLFPLLLPVDRSGQIEKLTSLLAATVGKRPRGMNLCGSVWDPSLITTLQSCNMEYVHLESSLIPSGRTKYLPVITGEQGKTVKILPTYREFIPFAAELYDAWLKRITQAAKKELSKKTEARAIMTIPFSAQEFSSFMGSPACIAISDEKVAAASNGVDLVLPQQYLKTAQSFVVTYVPAGMSTALAQWATVPYQQGKVNGQFPLTIHDYLNVYPQNRRLYERMMHLSMLISQYHGDKARRQTSREKLWLSQAGWSYVTLPYGMPAVAQMRQLSYQALNDADDVIHEEDARESMTSYDYNADGLNEYVCSMEKYTAVISLKAGSITELDVRKGGGNYAANLSRIEEFDGVTDSYQRGIFVEHLFESQEKKKYLSLEPAGNGIFSRVQFVEKKFDSKRHEVQMEGRGEFSSMQLPVILRKNYIASSSGILVQYILKNDSPLPLKALFVVESNFAQTVFADTPQSEYEAELVHDNQREELSLNKTTGYDSGVSTLLLTNAANKTSFVFEPNENSGFALLPVQFKRPHKDIQPVQTSETFCVSFFWDVDLPAGREMEKNVSISFVSARKKTRPRKNSQ